MSRIDFTFIKNKLYISGFLSGLLLATIVAIIITAVYMPEVNSKKVKGTLSGKECPRTPHQKANPDCSECH
jgi:hypothetical protein